VTLGRPGPRRGGSADGARLATVLPAAGFFAETFCGAAFFCAAGLVWGIFPVPPVCSIRLDVAHVSVRSARFQTSVRTLRRLRWFLSDPTGRHSNERSIEYLFALARSSHPSTGRVPIAVATPLP